MPPSTGLDPSTFTHAIVVLTVVLGASILRGLHDLDSTTLSTVYGAALGYASGLTMGRRTPPQ
jgi:hypothetical protein